jgi:K+-sensing histidine kinase KdpD
MFAHEMQGLVLSLRGQADKLVSEPHPSAPAVAAAATQLGALADELGHHLTPVGLQRALDCEIVALNELVTEAVTSLSATLSPGRRTWRVSGPPVLIWADRRGLRQVLARLLGEAVRSSAQDDWVEITWQAEHDQLVLTVEDEGAGTAMPPSMAANDDHVTQDTRGIGLRLSLARTLIQAHEGTMEVEALPRIGTRVTVSLPARRLRQETETAAG